MSTAEMVNGENFDEVDRLTALIFDPDPKLRADPYPNYHRLREVAPVHRSPAGFWLVSRYRDCSAALRDNSFGHDDSGLPESARGILLEEGKRQQGMLRMNPPDHTRLRNLIGKAFSARMVAKLETRIREIVDRLLTEALEAGEVDLIDAFAYPLPLTVMSELLGVPDADFETFKSWSRALARGVDPEFTLTPEEIEARERASVEFTAYFRELLVERRANPGEDLVSQMAVAEERGDVLTEAELLVTCVQLIVAGHETTVNLIGNGTLALLRNPDELRRFREDPSIAPSAVEELLRYDSPVQFGVRQALEEIDLDGCTIAPGDFVALVLGAANRDPEVYPEPDRLDLTRNGERHLSFGFGIHFCLGAPLARLEGQIALSELLRRAPALELTREPEQNAGFGLRGLKELPVRLA